MTITRNSQFMMSVKVLESLSMRTQRLSLVVVLWFLNSVVGTCIITLFLLQRIAFIQGATSFP